MWLELEINPREKSNNKKVNRIKKRRNCLTLS